MWTQLEQTFLRSLGPHALTDLGQIFTTHPSTQRFLVTIGGDQLTGKSTLTQSLSLSPDVLSIVTGGPIATRSTGQTMRDLATEKGVRIGELSTFLRQNNDEDQGIVDINLDYKTCQVLAGQYDETAAMLIMEGRQPAVMASYVTEQVPGASQLPFRVYLKCSVREQALRYIGREVHALAREEVERFLPQGGDDMYPTMEHVLAKMKGQTFAGHAQVMEGFRANMDRDADDKARFDMLYGEQCHYRNEEFYDLVIDTSYIEAEDKVNQVTQGWLEWLMHNNFGVKRG